MACSPSTLELLRPNSFLANVSCLTTMNSSTRLKALYQPCEYLLLLAMAELCFDKYDLPPVFLDDRLSVNMYSEPIAQHSMIQSCHLCSIISQNAVSPKAVLVGLDAGSSRPWPGTQISGSCEISTCNQDQTIGMRVIQSAAAEEQMTLDCHLGRYSPNLTFRGWYGPLTRISQSIRGSNSIGRHSSSYKSLRRRAEYEKGN